ncbi:MAG TPA: zf-HC2 domain-containing protein [Candidatus Sulfotelmatobacter sp.]|nr:zf-HC2 domain-containing protein [Candidatus Sulfotelmatobacter sp.]
MVNREAVNCEQVWREISNYVDGEVDSGLRAAMDEHFHTCVRCASVLAGTRNVIQLYGDERMIEAPAGFGRRLEKKLAQSARAGGSRWSSLSAWLVPVAALALIAGGLRLANSVTLSPPLKVEHAQPGHNIPPDMVVVVAAGSKIFHVAGCPFIHDKDKVRTLTAKQAIEQGYTPCMRCMRKYLETASLGRSGPGTEADADLDADEDPHRGGQ